MSDDREQRKDFNEWFNDVIELTVNKYDLMSQSEIKDMNSDIFRDYYTDGFRPDDAVRANFQIER